MTAHKTGRGATGPLRERTVASATTRFLCGAAAVIAICGASSAAYQLIADAAGRRRFPPPGRLVDIGGRHLHILTEGDETPPVVIIPALSSNVLEWVRVQRAASGVAQICVYDRAGVGWSDPPAGRLSIDRTADDLHALLKSAGIGPPWIIAGHSLGGVIARRFRSRYPEDVAGMLLIDSSHEDQVRRLPRGRLGIQSTWVRAVQRQARILGARRLAAAAGRLNAVSTASLGRETVPGYADAARMITLSSRQRRITVRELTLLARPQGHPSPLGSLPLTIVTGVSLDRRQWNGWPHWSVMQAELAALSTDTVHIAAVHAGHNVHLDSPEVIVLAIRDLVQRCADPGPVTPVRSPHSADPLHPLRPA